MRQQSQKIGVIGLGLMGLAMAKCLIRKGYVVVGCDVDATRQNLARQAGVAVLADAAQVASQAKAVFVVVLNADQIRSVLYDQGGLLHCPTHAEVTNTSTPPAIFLCSTIDPLDCEAFAESLNAAQWLAIDAPISGGPVKAEAGTMSMMLAASQAQLIPWQTLIDAVSGRSFWVSERPGDAMRAKLVNNLLAAAHLNAAGEALQWAQSMGLNLQTMIELIGASSGQSWMADDRVPRYLAADPSVINAQLHVLTKDVTLAVQAAARGGRHLAIGAHCAEKMQATCKAGKGQFDDSIMLGEVKPNTQF